MTTEGRSREQVEDLDTARLVTRIQAGDQDLFADLYERYFDRVYAYMRVLLRDSHEAEDATQEVLIKTFNGIADYERRDQPFRAWLFTIARNVGISHLRKHGRVDPEEPSEVMRRRDRSTDVSGLDTTIGWLSDRELLIFVDRLPAAQRQVLVLRFMLDMSTAEIAEILGSTEVKVRKLQHRALAFLRERLAAVGRRSSRGSRPLSWRRRPSQVRVLRDRRFALLR